MVYIFYVLLHPEQFLNMKEQVLDTSLERELFDMEQMDKGRNCLLEWISFINDSSLFYKKMTFGTPYLTMSPQVILAEKGEAEVTFDYKPYKLKKGEMILKPAKTRFTIESVSRDWKMRLVEFRMPQAMQNKMIFFHLDIIELKHKNFHRIKNYFDIIADFMENREKLSVSIEYLMLSMLSLVNAISAESEHTVKKSRVEVLFEEFMQELLKAEKKPREVSYYAKKMGIAASYLRNAVKLASKKSVSQWINEVTIHTAQEMLKDDSIAISEISERMGFRNPSSFTRFFKKHIGMTPGEYRDSKAVR
jgi:AraC-like DNA-binding protein